MGKSATIHLLPTKAAEKPKKGKRDPSVMKKAWATRRRNQRLAKRRGPTKPIQTVESLLVKGTPPFENMTAVGLINREGFESARQAIGEQPSPKAVEAGLVVRAIADAMASGNEAEAEQKLLQIMARSKFEGQKMVSEQHMQQANKTFRRTTEQAVCGFIAEVDHAQRMYGGLPPDQVWPIASFTVIKIVQALNDAGYTSRGYRKPETKDQA